MERLDPKLFNDATRKGSMLSGKLVTRSDLAYAYIEGHSCNHIRM